MHVIPVYTDIADLKNSGEEWLLISPNNIRVYHYGAYKSTIRKLPIVGLSLEDRLIKPIKVINLPIVKKMF